PPSAGRPATHPPASTAWSSRPSRSTASARWLRRPCASAPEPPIVDRDRRAFDAARVAGSTAGLPSPAEDPAMARNALAVIALIVLAAVLAISLAAQAHASTGPRCALPRGADVVAKHRSAVVYATRGHGGNDSFACSRLNGRRSKLGF